MPIHGYPGGVITANPTAPTSSVASGVWTTEQQLKAVAAGNWPFTIPTQQISRSLRFNSADTPSLSRTPGSAGNRQKFTISVWYKACGISTSQSNANIINAGGDGSTLAIAGTGAFGATYNDRMLFREAGTTLFYWPMVFRDPSAWYHIVFAMDTTQATAANRAKLYVNGVDQGAFSGTAISQNTSTSINNTSAHSIGLFNNVYPNNLYYAEYYLIDGQQLTPASFGRNNVETGVWEPLAYTGTYGTNGFYLNFSDNSGTTSTTLGKDSSGNGNNWTPNNFSVTAGAGNDSLVDSPTSYGTDTGVGGTVRGNYCTWNPLAKGSSTTLSNGNLDVLGSTNSTGNNNFSTFIPSSEKWYFEASPANTYLYSYVGISLDGGLSVSSNFVGGSANSIGVELGSGAIWRNGSNQGTGGTGVSAGETLMVAFEPSSGKMWAGRNGTWYNSGNPAAGTGQVATIPTVGAIGPAISPYSSSGTISFNFGQRAFAYTAPSGFKALCTQNLPTPTIGATSTTQANDYFDISLYTGNGTSQSITGLGFQPDFIWFKGRNTVTNHAVLDAVRGRSKIVFPSLSDAEATSSTTSNDLVSFNANGFSVGIPEQSGSINTNGTNVVAWNWNAGGSTVTNTSGTISSQVRANTTSGFSIVTYTGNGSAGATIGHGLGVAPSMIMIKCRNSGAVSWGVYHASVGNTAGLYLNLDFAAATTSIFWNNTSPTSSVFSVGNWGGVNGNTDTYVAYCFAPVASYSAFGRYTGNGSADGPFVYTGFRPEYVVVKRTNDTGNWTILDNARSTANPTDEYLWANLTAAEVANLHAFDFLSNGFKLRNTTSDHNSNGSTYIYMAFAEFPFKYALAR